MNNHEKAKITYDLIQARKKTELESTNAFAKSAKRAYEEVKNYEVSNVYKVKRRMKNNGKTNM